MVTPLDHSKLLDQLQTEVNRVLEQTGRVFAAAASRDIKNNPVAQASRLKLLLPDSVTRFHDALDQLEDELHLARLTMRRDLALCKVQPVAEIKIENDTTNFNGDRNPTIDSDKAQSSAVKQSDDSDVLMEDASDSKNVHMTNTGANQLNNDSQGTPRDMKVEDSDKPLAHLAEKNDSTASRISTKAQEASESLIKGDSPTKQEATGENDIAPDTALSNTVDLESLFGPTSATVAPNEGNLGGHEDSGDLFDFGFSTTDADGKPGTVDENDDIEAFLPGLQDYANTQPGEGEDNGTTDFDALFSDFDMQHTTESKDNENKGEEGRDTAFDELMDFNLDTGDFGAANGTGNQDDFNFDFS